MNARQSQQLHQQMAEDRKLDAKIRRNLEALRYGG